MKSFHPFIFNLRSNATVLASILAGIGFSSLNAQMAPDWEPTGALLVKLKIGTEAPQPSKRRGASAWTLSPMGVGGDDSHRSDSNSQWWLLAPAAGDGDSKRRDDDGSKVNPWDAAYAQMGVASSTSRRSAGETASPLNDFGVTQKQIDFVEPDFTFIYPSASVKLPAPATPQPGGGKAVAGSQVNPYWAAFKTPEGFLDNDCTQLAAARKRVLDRLFERDHSNKGRVRVAFLDTGYDPKHVTCPLYINKLGRNFVENTSSPGGVDLSTNPGNAGSQHHGTGTISIFGGREIELHSGSNTIFSGYMGGAPMADIIPMRVATSVVHLEDPLDIPFIKIRPSATTRAIRYAISQDCDVISMSHGGLPSVALAEAVNDAYDHGIAMFFASGDYLKKPNIPLHTPSYVVYPAAFSRAMCVCGITADNTTYGLVPASYNSAPIKETILMGNWGPDSFMRNAIAAYSPNTLWAHLPLHKNGDDAENVVDLDGAGTSAATPQAAAAATLWLEYHKGDAALTPVWRKWQKAEAVYQALKSSANPNKLQKDSHKYCGSGVLQANDALDKAPLSLLTPQLKQQEKAKVGLGWLKLLRSILPVRAEESLGIDAMLNLEIAQMISRDENLQSILDKYPAFDPEGADNGLSPQDTEKLRQELFQSLKNDPRCSEYLKNSIATALPAKTK